MLKFIPFIICAAAILLWPNPAKGYELENELHESAVYANSLQDEETKREQIRSVRFRGNRTYSNMVLRNIIATRQPSVIRRMQFWKEPSFDFVETDLRRDVIRIRRFYNRRGFYEADISYKIERGKRPNKIFVTFIIDEGEPVIINSQTYEFITDDPDLEERIRTSRTFRRANTGIRNPFAEGNRYKSIRRADMESNLSNRIMNLGHAFVKIDIQSEVDTAAYSADVHITIEPGPVAYFKNLRVEGNQTVTEELVKYQSDIRPGQRFSNTRMRRSQRLLFRHPLFRFVTVNLPDQPVSEEVDVRIRVREFPLRSVQVQAGLGTEEIIRGRVTWTHRNPFGNGHRFLVTTRGSFIEQRASLEYLIPGIFTPRSNFSVSPFVLRQNERAFLLRSAGVVNNLSYYYDQFFIANLGYTYSQNEIFQKDGARALQDDSQIFNISSLTLSALYNESTGDRGRGWAFRPFVEISGLIGSNSLVFQKVSLDARRFIDVTSSTQIALRANQGFLFTGASSTIPASIRYYTGGTNSVRGWSRSQLGPKRAVIDDDGNFSEYIPLGGEAVSNFNIEFRQDLPLFEDGLQFVAFLDGGQVWQNYEDINFREMQFGAGGGFRYFSPIGPIRLDFGYKLNPTDSDLNRFEGVNYGGINRWNIHFSIGQAF